MLSYAKSATARPGIKNGTTQLVNSWGVVKWADFQNKCSVPSNLIYTTTVVCEQDCDIVTLSDHLLRSVLNLLRREVSEHGRHLQQYFNLFVMYANLGKRSWLWAGLRWFMWSRGWLGLSAAGPAEKTQLLKLSVPATFMLVALDEGPGPPIKYQYAELGKLYAVVSQLVRCCDVSSRMQSSINGEC